MVYNWVKLIQEASGGEYRDERELANAICRVFDMDCYFGPILGKNEPFVCIRFNDNPTSKSMNLAGVKTLAPLLTPRLNGRVHFGVLMGTMVDYCLEVRPDFSEIIVVQLPYNIYRTFRLVDEAIAFIWQRYTIRIDTMGTKTCERCGPDKKAFSYWTGMTSDAQGRYINLCDDCIRNAAKIHDAWGVNMSKWEFTMRMYNTGIHHG